jgi:hypothetical protein
MTHGLFLQMCKNLKNVASQYAAVVIDEAHERSSEIDLTLALMAQLIANQSDDQLPMKLIIASATIGDMATELRDYLNDAGCAKVSALSLPGTSFPVHIEHRDDVDPDPKEIGSGGYGQIICSYAVQTTVDLVRASTEGNILVFLPGSGEVRKAIKIFSSQLSSQGSQKRRSKSQESWRSDSDDASADGDSDDDDDADGADDDDFAGRTVDDSHSHFSCSFAPEKGPKITLGVFGIHGKVSAELASKLFQPVENRVIVFATNVAETGITIPNIRYVVDTGLEKLVTWNPEANMAQMETTLCTQSSIQQRAGRAGRVASGICIRLFSEEKAEKFAANRPPAIQSSDVAKVVLRLKKLSDVPPLLSELPDQALEQATETLKVLCALDENGDLTELGSTLADLGVDVRTGVFLMASHRMGCLASSVLIAAALSTEAHELILPSRHRKNAKLMKYAHPSGDHLTVLNIIKALNSAKSKIRFCQELGIDSSVISDVESATIAISASLTHLKFTVVDSIEDEDPEVLEQAILRALAVAYFDFLVAPRRPGSPKDGFVRLLDSRQATAVGSFVDQFKREHSGTPLSVVDLPLTSSTDSTSPPSSHSSSSSSNSQPAPQQTQQSESSRARLSGRSIVWHVQDRDSSLALFGSIILADGASFIPSIRTLSYLSADDVEAAAAHLKLEVDVADLVRQNARVVHRIPISKDQSKYLLGRNTDWLQSLRRRFSSMVISVDKEKSQLYIAAPRNEATFAMQIAERHLSKIKAENIDIKVPSSVNMGKLLGKGGANFETLRNDLVEMVKRLAGANVDPPTLKLISEENLIRVTLSGDAKSFAGIVVGKIQSALYAACSLDDLPTLEFSSNLISASGAAGTSRTIVLATSTPPRGWKTRDDAMSLIAHALIWNGNCQLYGGFVRDWLIRGESANDIDTLLPQGTAPAQILQAISGVLARDGIVVSAQKQKGLAHTVVFRIPGHQDIEVDLVDPVAKAQNASSPGVDCDVGNMSFGRNGNLSLLVANPKLVSLAKSKRHCEKKQFVFYYNCSAASDMCQKRLTKYFSRGWTCLNALPPGFRDANLCQPKAAYNKNWWSM